MADLEQRVIEPGGYPRETTTKHPLETLIPVYGDAILLRESKGDYDCRVLAGTLIVIKYAFYYFIYEAGYFIHQYLQNQLQ